MNREIYIPPEGPPAKIPSKLIYEHMGEENIFRLLEDFYGELEQSDVRHLFPEDMVEASRRSAAFFVGLLGGPPLYQQRYGSPKMRARHLPFEIDEASRQVWLGCFKRTLHRAELNYNFPAEHLAGFIEFLEGFSAWMVNTKRG